MKKIFIVTGELSGDKVAAWYVAKQYQERDQLHIEGVGGDFLAATGVALYQRFEKLNVVGIVEIIKHLPRLLTFLNELVDYIDKHHFDEVILVDFPGFNLRLARMLKRRNKNLKITYLSPPQLWCWGAWRIKSLQKFCDDLVVLYPFEVAWYQQRGLNVRWIGSPVYDYMQPYFSAAEQKQPMIAVMFGSRISEIKTFTPIIGSVVQRLLQQYSELRFMVPMAASLPDGYVQQQVRDAGFGDILGHLMFVRDEHEKLTLLSQCCAALTKPGTVTLELALLKVPSVVFFKTSWLTYRIAKFFATIQSMALPNLLLNKQLFKEFIQSDCTVDALSYELLRLYKNVANTQEQESFQKDCNVLRLMLGKKV